jgi:hypothetical protein
MNNDIEKTIKEIIKNDLTDGRKGDDLNPYTDEEVKKFINDNKQNIETITRDIIAAYHRNEILCSDEMRVYIYGVLDVSVLF